MLDEGEEYKKTEKYLSLLEELDEKKQELEPFILKMNELTENNTDLYDKWKECMEQKRMTNDVYSFHVSMLEINRKII